VPFGSFRTPWKPRSTSRHGPIAIELIDRTMLGLAREIEISSRRSTCSTRRSGGDPFVEFGEEVRKEFRRLLRLNGRDAHLGLDGQHRRPLGGVVEVLDPSCKRHHECARPPQHQMSMKSEGKPISFVEDCRVPHEHFWAELTAQSFCVDVEWYLSQESLIREAPGTPAAPGTAHASSRLSCTCGRCSNLRTRQGHTSAMRRDRGSFRRLCAQTTRATNFGDTRRGMLLIGFHESFTARRLVQRLRETALKDPLFSKGLFTPWQRIVARPTISDDAACSDVNRPAIIRARETQGRTLRLDRTDTGRAGGGFPGRRSRCAQHAQCARSRARRHVPELIRVTREERERERGARQYAAVSSGTARAGRRCASTR